MVLSSTDAESRAKKDVVVYTVRSCARCGARHQKVMFRNLSRPFEAEEGSWTHWAQCPTNGEPILFKFEDGGGV